MRASGGDAKGGFAKNPPTNTFPTLFAAMDGDSVMPLGPPYACDQSRLPWALYRNVYVLALPAPATPGTSRPFQLCEFTAANTSPEPSTAIAVAVVGNPSVAPNRSAHSIAPEELNPMTIPF